MCDYIYFYSHFKPFTNLKKYKSRPIILLKWSVDFMVSIREHRSVMNPSIDLLNYLSRPINFKYIFTILCVWIREMPHLVLLQEVVPESLVILQNECPQFRIITAGNEGYFTAIMMHDLYVVYESHEIFQFYSSVMLRNRLTIKVLIDYFFHLNNWLVVNLISHAFKKNLV